ncbi:hypothetical protein GUJ93_ZPchr0004g39683 [Zizania palustris]|uniref:Uncharacterized protein n=1 Tax=Zizania palustris TaxID=103762 RepID=A0A8J5VZB6_ZIZPA|nr:hypothetical protein GUJ93_ZPchr0004g39683 [Zizania palustris]
MASHFLLELTLRSSSLTGLGATRNDSLLNHEVRFFSACSGVGVRGSGEGGFASHEREKIEDAEAVFRKETLVIP